MAKKQKNYLNNKDLYNEIVQSKADGKLTRTAIKMLILLSERAQLKLKYANPEDKQDCLAFAQLDLMKYWNSFNPDKTKNAFAYYTSICINGYAKGWHKIHPEKYKGTISINAGDGTGGIYTI